MGKGAQNHESSSHEATGLEVSGRHSNTLDTCKIASVDGRATRSAVTTGRVHVDEKNVYSIKDVINMVEEGWKHNKYMDLNRVMEELEREVGERYKFRFFFLHEKKSMLLLYALLRSADLTNDLDTLINYKDEAYEAQYEALVARVRKEVKGVMQNRKTEDVVNSMVEILERQTSYIVYALQSKANNAGMYANHLADVEKAVAEIEAMKKSGAEMFREQREKTDEKQKEMEPLLFIQYLSNASFVSVITALLNIGDDATHKLARYSDEKIASGRSISILSQSTGSRSSLTEEASKESEKANSEKQQEEKDATDTQKNTETKEENKMSRMERITREATCENVAVSRECKKITSDAFGSMVLGMSFLYTAKTAFIMYAGGAFESEWIYGNSMILTYCLATMGLAYVLKETVETMVAIKNAGLFRDVKGVYGFCARVVRVATRVAVPILVTMVYICLYILLEQYSVTAPVLLLMAYAMGYMVKCNIKMDAVIRKHSVKGLPASVLSLRGTVILSTVAFMFAALFTWNDTVMLSEMAAVGKKVVSEQ